MIQKRYRHALLFSIVCGLLLGVMVSGVWQRAPYYEPVQVLPESGLAERVPTELDDHFPVPERKRFLFLPLPWKTVAEPVTLDVAKPKTDDMEKVLREMLGKKLTLREQLVVVQIVLTRLNAEERRTLLQLTRGDVTMDEAFAAFRMLRERLTEDEMVLVFGLMQKYRSDLEELIRE